MRRTPRSNDWLMVSTSLADGQSHELFLRDGAICVAMTHRPIAPDGQRHAGAKIGHASKWPALRADILTGSCDAWHHEESDLSRQLAAATSTRQQK